MERYFFSIKREFWEHKATLIKAPLIVVAVVVGLLIFSAFMGGRYVDWQQYKEFRDSHLYFDIEAEDNSSVMQFTYKDKVIGEVDIDWQPPESQKSGLENYLASNDLIEGVALVSKIPYIIMAIIIVFIGLSYGLSCLYADRKDGSILFWKSLPQSETQMVLSKFFVLVAMLSAIAWGTDFLLSIGVFLLILIVAVISGIDGAVNLVLSQQQVIPAAFQYLGFYIAIILWSLPVMAWVLLASAFAKRTPFLVAAVPVVAISFIEEVLFDSQHFLYVVKDYALGILPGQQSFMIYDPSWWQIYHVFATPHFWVGLLITAIFLCGAIWLREKRFEIN